MSEAEQSGDARSGARRTFFGLGNRFPASRIAEFLRGPVPSGMLMHEPGPFDHPPSEPVELDPDELPWELRDEEGSPP